MTGRYDPIPDLAALIRDVAYENLSAIRRAEALLPRLGVGGDDLVTVEAIASGLRKAFGLILDLSDPDAMHVFTTALEDYAAKERDMAANEGGHESRTRWADLADQMRAQAEAAG
jgi:hypothetical protein